MVTVSTPVAWTFYPEKGSLTPRPDVPLWLMPATQAFTSASVANHITTIVPAVAVAPAWALEAGTLVHSLFQIHSYVAVIAQLAGVGCGAGSPRPVQNHRRDRHGDCATPPHPFPYSSFPISFSFLFPPCGLLSLAPPPRPAASCPSPTAYPRIDHPCHLACF